MTRPRVGLVTCEALPDLHEDDRPLVPALDALGVDAPPAIWSDRAVDWDAFDALVVRTPWDYFTRIADFRPWMDARIEAHVPLMNAGDILAWNYDKRYLREMEAAGVPIVPTIFVERGAVADVASLARSRGWHDVVVKPAISGGAYQTYRYLVDDAAAHNAEVQATLADRALMVQPFLPEIQTDGELSLLFFDGVFSHAVRKRPKTGDYRVQASHGGTIEDVSPEPSVVQAARRCVSFAPSPPVYARVDGLALGGRFVLMELEVFEPQMFLSRDPQAPARFARAILNRLRSPA